MTDLAGKVALVTGGSRGIGAAIVRRLARDGAAVAFTYVAAAEKAQAVAKQMDADGGRVLVIRADNADPGASVAAVEQTVRELGRLDILVNNAGIMAVPELEKTPQGFELQFGTNFLGHFALTIGLHTALAAANGARVVSVSSTGHLFSPVIFDDLNFDFVPYTPIGAYGQSKTADALLAVGITKRWADDGIRSNTLLPSRHFAALGNLVVIGSIADSGQPNAL
jgi:NAD(P)-dependent dehydrogenase (short-subunit alcohol dehydrogenase family)